MFGGRIYAKIFAQIFDSSLAEDYQVRHVFEDFLKLADLNGVVDMTAESIARRTNVPLEIVQRGIVALESPDPRSRSKGAQGRRIVRLDDHREWGWLIVNYAEYRAIASEEQRREKTLARVRKHRANKKESDTSEACNAPVTQVNASNAMQKQKQKQREKQKKKDIPAAPVVSSNPTGEHAALIKGWSDNFKSHFGFDYSFNGGRDGKAVKQLLTIGVLRIDLLEIAKKAWERSKQSTDSFNCKQAVTLHGFQDRFNQIRAEIASAHPTARPPTPLEFRHGSRIYTPENPPKREHFGNAPDAQDFFESTLREFERKMETAKK